MSQHPDELSALRAQITEDRKLLESLDPATSVYRRLRQRLEQQTGDLLDAHERHEHHRRAMMNQRPGQNVEDRSSELGVATAVLLLGGFIVYFAWGGWWVTLGFALIMISAGGFIGTTTTR